MPVRPRPGRTGGGAQLGVHAELGQDSLDQRQRRRVVDSPRAQASLGPGAHPWAWAQASARRMSSHRNGPWRRCSRGGHPGSGWPGAASPPRTRPPPRDGSAGSRGTAAPTAPRSYPPAHVHRVRARPGGSRKYRLVRSGLSARYTYPSRSSGCRNAARGSRSATEIWMSMIGLAASRAPRPGSSATRRRPCSPSPASSTPGGKEGGGRRGWAGLEGLGWRHAAGALCRRLRSTRTSRRR